MKNTLEIKEQKALLVIAHPDDEVMFFGPLLNEFQRSKSSEISILCLSTGNFDGIGKARVEELFLCGANFGIPKERITIVDHFLLQDGMENNWSLELIETLVGDHITQHKFSAVSSFHAV
jgi:N-acetylglucosaminylphosphatidylinositol deacetylase